MKKTLFFIAALFAAVSLFGQTVPRNIVVMEVGTATWCTYCPGSAKAIDQMETEGKSIGVIEYHSSDSYSNGASAARMSYYGMSGIPTCEFDGKNASVGGYPCAGGGTCYNDYVSKYNNRINVESPLSIFIDGTNSGDDYTIVLSIHKVGTITSTTLKAHLALTESNISQSWQGCMTKLNNVERMMVPDQNGTNINFNTSDMVVLSLSFTKNPAWVTSNCKLVAFVQDNSTKEILNGAIVNLTELTPPMAVDFTSNVTVGCAPANIQYTSTAPDADNFLWFLPGADDAAPTAADPSVNYTTAGTFNAKLTAWSDVTWHGNLADKSEYLTILATPPIAGTPSGPDTIYSSVTPTTDFTTTGAQYATNYDWFITPSEAGTISGTSTTGTVTWASGYAGTATITVQGNNTCGTGVISQPLDVTIGTALGIAQPSGKSLVTLYPNPASGSVNIIPAREMNVNVRVYNSIGNLVMDLGNIDLKSSYQVNTSALSPGVYFFNLKGNNFQEIKKMIIE